MLVMFAAGFIVQIYLKSSAWQQSRPMGGPTGRTIVLAPVFGLTGALLPIAAQNFGLASPTVRAALFTCWKFGWLFMLVACPILFIAANNLMRVLQTILRWSKLVSATFISTALSCQLYDAVCDQFIPASIEKTRLDTVHGIYRQAFGVAFFSYLYIYHLGFGVVGIWYGIATSVLTGFLLSLALTNYAARPIIGGLLTRKDWRRTTLNSTRHQQCYWSTLPGRRRYRHPAAIRLRH